MTDIQVESGLEKKRGRARKQSDDASYDQALAKGQQLVARLKAQDEWVVCTELELGQLADQVQTKWKPLSVFAKEIGISADRLNRCRSVYRSYKDKNFKGAPPKFAVLQALQGHPRRYEILEQNPNLTMREARTRMRDYRLGQGIEEPKQEEAKEQAQAQEEEQDQEQAQAQEEEPAQEEAQAPDPEQEPEQEPAQPQPQPQVQEPWQVIEARRWFTPATKRALAIVEYGHPAQQHLDPATLRQALGNNLKQTLDAWRECSAVSKAWADAVERALAPAPTPMFDDAPGEAAPDDAAPDKGTPDSAATSD
jgi:hypothetical protein